MAGPPARETVMPIWKLTPSHPEDPAWQASRHLGPAVVRAASENAARRAAALAFRVVVDAPSSSAPWTNPALVEAAQIDDARYDPRGENAVLDPAA